MTNALYLSERFSALWQGKNVFEVPHQEKRTMVCAQCHVEYYFKGKGKYLTFPCRKRIIIM